MIFHIVMTSKTFLKPLKNPLITLYFLFLFSIIIFSSIFLLVFFSFYEWNDFIFGYNTFLYRIFFFEKWLFFQVYLRVKCTETAIVSFSKMHFRNVSKAPNSPPQLMRADGRWLPATILIDLLRNFDTIFLMKYFWPKWNAKAFLKQWLNGLNLTLQTKCFCFSWQYFILCHIPVRVRIRS